MYDFITIIISVTALLISRISLYLSRKDKIQEDLFNKRMADFEFQKEKIRKLERNADIIEERFRQVSVLMPYFSLCLFDISFKKWGEMAGLI